MPFNPKPRLALEAKTKKEYESNGYVCYRQFRHAKFVNTNRGAMWRTNQSDIFGIIDLICFKIQEPRTVFIQVTSTTQDNNAMLRDHMRKIVGRYNLPYAFHLIYYRKNKSNRWMKTVYSLIKKEFVDIKNLGIPEF